MRKATAIIERVAQETDRVVLFHSASGKDSIALLHLLAPHFKEIVCVFMYVVKDLHHINRYIRYAMDKYPNIKFVQVPHFATYSYRKTGFMGCEQDATQRKYTLADIDTLIRERTGIEWSFYGFKMSDSLNRRLMLRQYDLKAINWETKKCYPLSDYLNKQVLHYIQRNKLMQPERYGTHQSSGTSLIDIEYLLFLRTSFPQDLKKVIAEYPETERMLFEYDYERKEKDEHKAVTAK